MRRPSTIDSNTRASNPGNVILKPHVWLMHNKGAGFVFILGFVVFTLLLVYGSALVIVPLLIIFAFFAYPQIKFYWGRKKDHFEFGDSNGGIIISENPSLVAVTTNLTKGFGDYPVIKIIKYKGKGKVGDRIGTVALYTASADDSLPHWIDFHPIPIEYATNNTEEINSAIESYDENQWIQIQDRLKEVPKPFKEGIFKVDVEDSDWRKM